MSSMRRGYNPTFISVVDIIAAFFTDTFVNELYQKAKQLANSGKHSITEQYRIVIMRYADGVSNDAEKCKFVIIKLRDYYSVVTKYSSITYIDFENAVLEQFIPSEYYKDFRSSDKSVTMSSIVVGAVQSAFVYISKPEIMKSIIDQRGGDQPYVIGIQDHIAESIISRRDEFFIDFARKINEKPQKVSMEILYQLRDELKKQVALRCEAERELAKAKSIIVQLVEKIKNVPAVAPTAAPAPSMTPAPTIVHQLNTRTTTAQLPAASKYSNPFTERRELPSRFTTYDDLPADSTTDNSTTTIIADSNTVDSSTAADTKWTYDSGQSETANTTDDEYKIDFSIGEFME